MPDTNIAKNSEELSGLSALLFDKAVALWYTALVIEIIAGLLAVGVSLFDINKSWSIFFALLGFALLTVSYYLKIRYALIYDNAETMRRQAVLSNALGWPINPIQFSEWRRLAGPKILTQFDAKEIDPNYFATKQPPSSLRLLEMTQESAFWTRHLYCYLRNYVWFGFVFSLIFVLIVLSLLTTEFVPRNVSLNIALIITSLLPLILTIDLLGWGLKLNQLINAICRVEMDLNHLPKDDSLDERQVLRLVAEYNCQVSSGFPIPNWFFKRHHDLIQKLWNRK